MGQITLSIQYEKNKGTVLNPSQLRDLFFFGIDIRDKHGNPIPDATLDFYLKSVQEEVEKWLSIKFAKQVLNENRSYNREDFVQWGFCPTTFPVRKGVGLIGKLNQVPQIRYPVDWLASQANSNDRYHRQIYLIPNMNNSSGMIIGSSGMPYLMSSAYSNIPFYWDITYLTGFNTVPNDLIHLIGKLSAIQAFGIAGDLLMGVGVSSFSIGIDGLSQSVSSTKTPGQNPFAARINQFIEDIKQMKERTYNYYKGLTFISI